MKKLALFVAMMSFIVFGGLAACSVDCEVCAKSTTTNISACTTATDVDSADCEACGSAVGASTLSTVTVTCTEV